MAPFNISLPSVWNAQGSIVLTIRRLHPPRESLKGAMTGIASAIGPVNRLDEAIVAAQPNHPDMKLVKHRDEKAFVIASPMCPPGIEAMTKLSRGDL